MADTDLLAVAGLDPSGAAGLLRDAWAIEVAGGSFRGAAACLTAQGPSGCHGVRDCADFLGAQLDALEVRPRAVKIGFVASVSAWHVLEPWLRDWEGLPVVVDPVRGPSAGGFEHGDAIRDTLLESVVPRGVVLTPNLPELDWLGLAPEALLARGAAGILVKGGHAREAATVEDHWFDATGEQAITRARHTGARRGTGCVLSSLLAYELGQGRAPGEAARSAGHRLGRLWDRLAT